jgi:uncharacterized repeat protein (TIGR01451 family)
VHHRAVFQKNRSRTNEIKEKYMKGKSIVTTLLIALLLLPAMAMAAGNVDVKIKTEKLSIELKDGKKVARAVPASKFQPGDTIIYTITYTNNAAEPVTDAVINDPIPAGTIYINNSAKGEGADITFSIDNGKTFLKPTLLFYEVSTGAGKKEQKVASPDHYTNVRWNLTGTIPPKGSGKVSFRVKVK